MNLNLEKVSATRVFEHYQDVSSENVKSVMLEVYNKKIVSHIKQSVVKPFYLTYLKKLLGPVVMEEDLRRRGLGFDSHRHARLLE